MAMKKLFLISNKQLYMFYLIAVQSVWLVRLQFEQIPRNKFNVLTQRTVSNSLSMGDQLEIMAIYSIVVDTTSIQQLP